MAGIHNIQIHLARPLVSLSTVQANTGIAAEFLPHVGIMKVWTRWPDPLQSTALLPTHNHYWIKYYEYDFVHVKQEKEVTEQARYEEEVFPIDVSRPIIHSICVWIEFVDCLEVEEYDSLPCI